MTDLLVKVYCAADKHEYLILTHFILTIQVNKSCSITYMPRIKQRSNQYLLFIFTLMLSLSRIELLTFLI